MYVFTGEVKLCLIIKQISAEEFLIFVLYNLNGGKHEKILLAIL